VRRGAKGVARWGLNMRWRVRPPDHSRAFAERVAGLDLVVLPTVFHPTWHFTSRFLAEEYPRLLRRGEGPACSVLEVGTGTGVVALAAARAEADVVAVDSNPVAVKCASLNAAANGLAQKVSVLRGDMFGPVAGRRFDVILCNPPYFRGVPRSQVEAAYKGGERLEWLARLGAGAKEHLAPGGSMFCVFGDAAEVGVLVGLIEGEGWSGQCMSRRDLPWEQVSIWRFLPTRPTSAQVDQVLP
ncbi:MAG: methyltransferase, partial [Chloroflexia bacterium]